MKAFLFIFTIASLLAFYTGSVQGKRKVPNKLLTQFAESQIGNVFYPTYQKMNSAALELKNEIGQQCSDLNLFSRQTLKDKLTTYAKAFHFSEAFQIGRVNRNAGELKEKLYAFPNANLSMIDIEVAMFAENPDHAFRDVPNALGLSALEYLIFDESLTNSCFDCGQDLLENWNKKTDQEKLSSRCSYLAFAADKIHQGTQELITSWAPVNGKFTRSDSFRADIVSGAEFAVKLTKQLNFFDRQMKDQRLGIPSGYITEECGFNSCPERSEHQFSNLSILSLIQGLKGLVAVLNASPYDANYNITGKSFGFNGILASVNQEGISLELENRAKQVITNLEKHRSTSISELSQGYLIDDCLASTSSDRKVEVCSLYADIKQVTDFYKNEFITAVDLGKPDAATADPD